MKLMLALFFISSVAHAVPIVPFSVTTTHKESWRQDQRPTLSTYDFVLGAKRENVAKARSICHSDTIYSGQKADVVEHTAYTENFVYNVNQVTVTSSVSCAPVPGNGTLQYPDDIRLGQVTVTLSDGEAQKLIQALEKIAGVTFNAYLPIKIKDLTCTATLEGLYYEKNFRCFFIDGTTGKRYSAHDIEYRHGHDPDQNGARQVHLSLHGVFENYENSYVKQVHSLTCYKNTEHPQHTVCYLQANL